MASRGPIEQAVRRDLDADLLASALGQATLAAAKRMDNAMADDRSFAAIYRELRTGLDALREVGNDRSAGDDRRGP